MYESHDCRKKEGSGKNWTVLNGCLAWNVGKRESCVDEMN